LCTVRQICNQCTGFIAMTTYTYVIHICKLIALCTANAYSAECRMLVSACVRSMTGLFCFIVQFLGFQKYFCRLNKLVHLLSYFWISLRF